MFALTIPWLLVAVVIIAIAFLLKKKWLLTLILITFCLFINTWFHCIPFRLLRSSTSIKGSELNIVSFNIDGSNGDIYEKARNVRDFLRTTPPDIVFIAEYNEQYPRVIDNFLREDYTYSSFPEKLFFHYFYGKEPFFNSRRLKDSQGFDTGIFACSTTFQGDTIDLYGCHFASNNYNSLNERFPYDNIDNKEDLLRYLKNLSKASARRKEESEILLQEMAKSPHQAIVMGDLNDVCGSPALRRLESQGLIDCWWEGGLGYGPTIHKPIAYRIDHIMHTPGLKLKSVRVLDSNGISDHDALQAVFQR